MGTRAGLSAQVWLGCLSGADGKTLADHDEEIFREFAETYASYGGPRVDAAELHERFVLHFPSYVINNFGRIETHILKETPVETWKTYTSKEDVFAGPWNARCYSIMIANCLSYWYHKGENHPGAVVSRWAAKHGIEVK